MKTHHILVGFHFLHKGVQCKNMQPKILLIQFRHNPIHSALETASIVRELGGTVDTVCLSALDESVTWNDPATLLVPFDGVILGGSGDFDFDGGRVDDDSAKMLSYELLERLRPLFDYIFTTDFPTLGICFGHQMIGAYAGANVRHDPRQKKSRSHKVSVVTSRAPALFNGVATTFYAHYGHKDSLDQVPQGATLVVQGGEECLHFITSQIFIPPNFILNLR
jgi:GMP synthase-like glutamine amidotransferase